MRLLFRLSLTVIFFFLILAILWISLPRLLETIVQSQLEQQGFSEVKLVMGKIGLQSTTVERIQLSNEEMNLAMQGLQADYHLSELFSGSLISLHAEKIRISKKPVADSGPVLPDPLLLLSLLRSPWDEYLPARSLIIDSISIYDTGGAPGLSASVDVFKQKRKISGDINIQDSHGAAYRLIVEASPGAGVVVQLHGSSEDTEIPLSARLSPTDSGDGLTGKIRADLSKIKRLVPGESRLSGWLMADFSYFMLPGSSKKGFAVTAELKDVEFADVQFKSATVDLQGSIDNMDNVYRVSFAEKASVHLKGLQQEKSKVATLLLTAPKSLDISDRAISLSRESGAQIVLNNVTLDNISIPQMTLKNIAFTATQDNEDRAKCGFKMQLVAPTAAVSSIMFTPAPVDIDGACAASVNTESDTIQWSMKASTANLQVEGNNYVLPLKECRMNIATLPDPNSNELNGEMSCQSSRQSGKVQSNFHFNTVSGAGRASYSIPEIKPNSETPLFSSLLKNWNEPYDLVSGNLSGSGEYRWWKDSKGLDREKLNINLNVRDAGGFYEGILFSGLDYKDTIEILPTIKTTNFAKLSIRDIDIGIPVEETAASLKYSNTQSGDLPIVTMNNLSLSLLGGKIVGNDVDIDLNRDMNNLVLVVVGLDLAQIVALQQVDGLSATGRLDGYVPITVTTEGVKISDGKIVSQPQGGQIKYIPAGGSAEIEKSAVGSEFVFRIIEDLNYDTLNIDVNYDESGELVMMLALKGMSPKVDKKRPVHFNLNLQQNILKLLRGLRYAEGLSEDIDNNVQKYFRKQQNPVN